MPWATIGDISDEIAQAGSEEEAYEIAYRRGLLEDGEKLDGTQEKTVLLNDGFLGTPLFGTRTSVVMIGFNHDVKSEDGTRAGITFAFADSVAVRQMNSTQTNSGGWKASELRDWLNSDFESLLSQELRSEVVNVVKMTNNVGETASMHSGVVGPSDDRFWLLSVSECLGDCSSADNWQGEYSYLFDIAHEEGDQYEAFRNAGVHTPSEDGFPILERACVVKDAQELIDDDELDRWWLRSPSAYTSGDFATESDSEHGNTKRNLPDGNRAASGLYGVSPCFCV